MEARSDPDRLFAEFRRTADPRALGEVYDRLAPELLRIALHTARDPAEAEDVLQATFLAAIEQAQRFDPERRVLPWLVGMLANEVRKARERGTRRPDPERLARGASSTPDEEAERSELLAELDAALARIPEAFRPVLQLRLRHGLAVPEIAAALERPPGTVRSQLARGSELLRRALPAGLAGALALVVAPTRGLAAVRTTVVEHAATLQGSATTATAIGGLLVVKKLIAVAALLVAAVALVLVSRSALEPRARPAPDESVSVREPQAPARLETAATPPPGVHLDTREALAGSIAPSTVEPAPTTELCVIATWPDGTRAAGELVLVLDALSSPRQDEWQAFTDEQGVARFSALASGAAQVRLLRGGETNTRLAPGRTSTVELAIRSGVTVAGIVLDEHEAPVAAAEVWLSERYRNNLGHVVAHTDADGRFELRAVGPDHWIGARASGYEPSGLRGLAGGGGDRRELALVLARRGARVRGRVLDELGQPLARARVLLGQEQSAPVRVENGSFAPAAPPQRTRTDEDGRFELACTPFGLQPLQVRAQGCAPYLGVVDVQDDDRNEVTLTLRPTPRVLGRVRGPDGKPLASVWIRWGDSERFASSSAWSEVDGRFELVDLALGRQTIVAQHERHGEARRELVLAPGETHTWEVELRAVPMIHGRLLDSRGKPRAGLIVVAARNEERSWRARSNQSDAEGRFAIGDLEERAYLLWVQPGAEAGGWRGFPLFEQAEAWPSTVPLELVLPDGAERARIAGEVFGADGTPVVGAELQVWHEESRQWRSFPSTGERGEVNVAGIPAGTVELELRHAEHPWKVLGRHELEPGTTLELGRIEFGAAGTLRVRLVGDVREAIGERGLLATLADATNHESGVARCASDELTAGPLAPGEHLLVLGGDGVRQVRRPFRIEPGVETSFELQLEACGVREVTFVLPASAEIRKWIACSLRDAQGTLVWGGSADCTRTPPLVRVSAPPGSYTLMAGGPGGCAGQIEILLATRGVELPALVLALAPKP